MDHDNLSIQSILMEGNGTSDIPWRTPFLWPVLAAVCFLTTTGNCLVVLAVCTKKYLRNPTGYLIISLAMSDLIMGLTVMPLNSLFEMTQHTWLLGLVVCDIWHALDILASTSSIWNLCVISIDRYLALREPIGYRDRVSKKRILIAIFAVWGMSVVLSFPAIAWWRRFDPEIYDDDMKCIFTGNAPYIIFSSLVTFYIPLCLIVYSYGNVFIIASRHSRARRSGIKTVTVGKNSSKLKKESESGMSDEQQATLRIHFGRPDNNNTTSKSMKQNRPAFGQATTKLLLKQMNVREKSRKMLRYVHEQRAARTLSIVVGAFILCWLPFFVFSPLQVICRDCFANADQLFVIFTWAGHLNSMLNPLIYSRFSRDFRRAFKQLLTCQRERKARIIQFNSQSSDMSCE